MFNILRITHIYTPLTIQVQHKTDSVFEFHQVENCTEIEI